MAASYRAIAVTGVAVASFCLAVSLGPRFLFRGASEAGDDYHAAQAQFPAPSQGLNVGPRGIGDLVSLH
jgi:hypothetical protein